MKKLIKINKNHKTVFIISAAVIIAAAIAVAILLSLKIKPHDTIKLSEMTDSEGICLIADMGLSSSAPENTAPAYELAAKNGFDYVRFQIQLTKDELFVVSKYSRLEKMTNGNGKILNKTYFDLADYNIDNGANYKKYDSLKILSLDKALDICLENGLSPIIEINKCNEESLKKLINTVKTKGYEKSCIIISSDFDIIDSIRTVDDEIKLIYYMKSISKSQIEKCLERSQTSVCIKKSPSKKESQKLKTLTESGVELYCDKVKNEKDLNKCIDSGIKNIITDRIIPG